MGKRQSETGAVRAVMSAGRVLMEMRRPSCTYGEDGGGSYIEWYRDDLGSEGYGDNPVVCRWYGTRDECMERAKLPPPPAEEWVPLLSRGFGPSSRRVS